MRSGFVHARRPAQRRQVDPAQPDPRQKVTIVSDKPQTTRTQVRGVLNRPGRPGRVRRHARHPQAPHAARRAAQRHRHRRHRRRRRRVPRGRRHRAVRPRRPVGGRPACPRTRSCVVNKVDVASPDEVLAAAGRGRRARPGRVLPGVGQDRRRRRRAGRARSSAGCPRGRSTTPTTWSPTCPRRSGWPSWCASSCWPSPATRCRTRSPPGSPSGSGPASAARSSSSASRRRAS